MEFIVEEAERCVGQCEWWLERWCERSGGFRPVVEDCEASRESWTFAGLELEVVCAFLGV